MLQVERQEKRDHDTYLVAAVTVVAVVKCALLGVLAVDHIVVKGGGGGGGLLYV